jgi:hypothetical protein
LLESSADPGITDPEIFNRSPAENKSLGIYELSQGEIRSIVWEQGRIWDAVINAEFVFSRSVVPPNP